MLINQNVVNKISVFHLVILFLLFNKKTFLYLTQVIHNYKNQLRGKEDKLASVSSISDFVTGGGGLDLWQLLGKCLELRKVKVNVLTFRNIFFESNLTT